MAKIFFTVLRLAWTFLFGVFLPTCHKIPLKESLGEISYARFHWFENEQTAYVFFEISEDPSRYTNPTWEIQLEHAVTLNGKLTDYLSVDFDAGVHKHTLQPCGHNLLCGSYSFRSEISPGDGTLIFNYDPDSQLKLTRSLTVIAHNSSSTADSFSALAYGVFDSHNEAIQARILDNFGDPNSSDVKRFGMQRQFLASVPLLKDVTLNEVATANDVTATSALFPANSLCQGLPLDTPATPFQTQEFWLPNKVDRNVNATAACFNLAFLDKKSNRLLAENFAVLARRNPVIVEPELELKTPLRSMHQIPIQIAICDDEPFAASMTNREFLDYQRFILNLSTSDIDLCFRVNRNPDFKAKLTTLLANKLSQAKSQNADKNDFVFVVLFHHRFSQEFESIHQDISAALAAITVGATSEVSPKLRGAFVYETAARYRPTGEQQKSLIWCPQQIADQISDPMGVFAAENCTTTKASEFNLKIINFVAPLGPLPSLANYQDYVSSYGDLGLAHDPKLNFYSVPIGVTTRTEKNLQVTFFDLERFTLTATESAKFCFLRDLTSIRDFRFRSNLMPDSTDSVAAKDINPLWLTNNQDISWRIGLTWEFPFWGGISYESPVTGKFVNIIPFSRSFKNYEQLGDAKWQTPSWNLGRFIQQCRAYCDNPIFDAAGSYQLRKNWRTDTDFTCPKPSIPEVN